MSNGIHTKLLKIVSNAVFEENDPATSFIFFEATSPDGVKDWWGSDILPNEQISKELPGGPPKAGDVIRVEFIIKPKDGKPLIISFESATSTNSLKSLYQAEVDRCALRGVPPGAVGTVRDTP